ncbi:ankyrin repeat-containing domain protein [Mycena floridula]|nr:ankyrin repeat-containing domain protein [Mycena floridula]
MAQAGARDPSLPDLVLRVSYSGSIKAVLAMGASLHIISIRRSSTTMDHTALLGSLDKIASCATKLDLSGARVVFFSRLTSLQTIIRFMSARVHDDDVLQPVTGTLCDIAMNLDMEQPGWPFTQNNEQTIIAAITHIESQLSSPQPELPSSPIPTKDIDSARVTTYANGSSVHLHADHITGNIEGSFLSNNNIRFDADPAVHQGIDNLLEYAIDTATIKKRKKFLDWISKLDFQATQMETFAKHSPGTGDWFFKRPEFVDWRDGRTKFLWCPGMPGAGKTILSSIIINHLRSISGPAPAVLYIYCDYTYQSHQTPMQLLGNMDFDAVVDVELLTSICAGLVIISKESSYYEPIVQLVHYTTHEYFQLKQHQLFPNIHSSMAITCLTYMSFDAFSSDDITPATWKLYSLYRYAVLHWAEHAQQDEAAVSHHICKFFEKKTNLVHAASQNYSFISWLTAVKAHTLICLNGHIDAVQLILSREDINSSSINTNLGNPLLFAVSRGHMDIVKLLLEQQYIDTTVQDEAQRTPLSYAAAHGNIEVVQLLLQQKDVDLTISEQHQQTPLSYAAKNGHFEITKLLLDWKDTTFTARDKYQRSPLSYAVKNGHLDIIKLLLQQENIDPNFNTKLPPLTSAAAYGHLEILKLLLDSKNVNPNACDLYQYTALAYAAERERPDIDSNASTIAPPLTYAATIGHLDIVELLLAQKDIHINASNPNQITSLGYAVMYGHLNIVRLLLQQDNVNPDACDKSQRSLSYAAEKGHTDIVDLLLQRDDVNPESCDIDGHTPLS